MKDFCPKDCPNRVVGCRADCQRWKEKQAQHQAEKAQRDEIKKSNSLFIGYAVDMDTKRKRRNTQ